MIPNKHEEDQEILEVMVLLVHSLYLILINFIWDHEGLNLTINYKISVMFSEMFGRTWSSLKKNSASVQAKGGHEKPW